MTEGIQTFADYRQTYKAKLKTCLDVAYVVGDTSNWAYDDHKNSNVAIKTELMLYVCKNSDFK
jgi:hypothetical protein